jgi:hypothetical protein
MWAVDRWSDAETDTLRGIFRSMAKTVSDGECVLSVSCREVQGRECLNRGGEGTI